MQTKEESLQSTTNVIRPWSFSSALAVGAFGFIVVIVAFATLSTWGMYEFSKFQVSPAEIQTIIVIISTAATFVAGYLLARILVVSGHHEFFDSIAWRWSILQIVPAILLGLCATFLVRIIITGHLMDVTLRNMHPTRLFVLMLLSTVIVVPFVEEIYFRGILFTGLSCKLSPFLSICIVTLVFDLGHGRHHWIVLPISILLAIVRLRTKSTANCFALHAAYNLGVVLWGIK